MCKYQKWTSICFLEKDVLNMVKDTLWYQLYEKKCFSQKSRKQVLEVGENAILTFSLTGSDDKIIFNAIGKIQSWTAGTFSRFIYMFFLVYSALFPCLAAQDLRSYTETFRDVWFWLIDAFLVWRFEWGISFRQESSIVSPNSCVVKFFTWKSSVSQINKLS